MNLLIIGRPNVGKTLLMINLVAYLGLREIRIDVQDDDGVRRSQRLGLERARRQLVSLEASKTIRIQAVAVDVAAGHQHARVMVLDTPGISLGISPSLDQRRQTALTLEYLLSARMIFHVMDASAVPSHRDQGPEGFDAGLMEFGRHKPGYLLVANKMDRPGSHEGLRILKDNYRDVTIIPVSSATRRGFRDLKVWILRAIP